MLVSTTQAVRPSPAEELPSASPNASAAKVVDFNREVRPILSKNCFACHGSDEAKRAKGLRLDVRGPAMKPLKSGETAIVPGDPDSSDLVARISEEDDTLRMPPRKAGNRLTPVEVDVLTRWVQQGAKYDEHWALIPPRAEALPKVENAAWPRNGVDYWVLARLEQEGLHPSPEADPYTLLRRASLDLRGLPPTPREVEQFLDDKSPGAYERAVDRFLDDPAYGERWARMWLDLARYADSAGYGSDPLRTIWRYRDWVIAALNRNLPYDQFTIEQIAGDLLPGATPRPEDRHGVSSQHDDQHRRRDRRRGVPRRRDQGPRRHHDAGLDGPDDGLRQVPHPQVRPAHERRVLQVLCDLQPDGRHRSARRVACDPRCPRRRSASRSARSTSRSTS